MEFPAPRGPSKLSLPHRSQCTECTLVTGSTEEVSSVPSGKASLTGVLRGFTGWEGIVLCLEDTFVYVDSLDLKLMENEAQYRSVRSRGKWHSHISHDPPREPHFGNNSSACPSGPTISDHLVLSFHIAVNQCLQFLKTFQYQKRPVSRR